MLINFAIGVATGLVQEFQFGMNWSIYSEFVGDVFGAPLAIEGLAAFMLESTFLGLWIFGWDRLSKRVHLATIWLFALGSWLSAFFIIVANSWMQRPVGSAINDGRAELTDVWALMSNRLGIVAYTHVILVGLTTACVVVFGIACWHLVRGRNQQLFLPAAKLALVVGVPISALNLADRESPRGRHHRLPTDEDRRDRGSVGDGGSLRRSPCSRSVASRSTTRRRRFDIEIPDLLSILATGSLARRGAGDEAAAGRVRGGVRGRELHPAACGRRTGACGSWPTPARSSSSSSRSPHSSTRRRTLATKPWLLWVGIAAIPLPYVAALAGWVLTEVGRQPWIVFGLLKTADANSPSVSTTTIAVSLGVFALLYGALAVVDVVLMRRYARLDPPEVGGDGDEFALPAVSY